MVWVMVDGGMGGWMDGLMVDEWLIVLYMVWQSLIYTHILLGILKFQFK